MNKNQKSNLILVNNIFIKSVLFLYFNNRFYLIKIIYIKTSKIS